MVEKKINGIDCIAGQWPLDAEKATLLFIHGSGNTAGFWKAQVEGLAALANTVAISLPGHGGSPGAGMDTIVKYAGVVADYIDAIQAPSPIPCGLSMGGAITLQLLLDGNAKYRAGIVVNSGARLKVMPAIFDLIKNDYEGYLRMFPSVALSPKTDPASMEEVMADARECDPGVVYNDFIACNTFDVMDRLHEITVPVLVLTAEDDKLSPPKYGRYLADQIPHARGSHIMDAGHMSPVERPGEVNQAIGEFIKLVAGGR